MNRDLKNAVRNHQVANAEIFDGEDNNDNNRKKEGEEKLEDNIDIPTADSYLYAVTMTYMYLQK